jgi:2-polyprenyl-3-methyl-5-hydroxy-6-metoxy-1,4-benzoquinol methylase
MSEADLKAANAQTRSAWNANAAFWDERMGEGNDFVEVLIWPAARRMLDLKPGERVLDIACGNGLYARRMAALGAEVVAFDFSEELIARAREHNSTHASHIQYHVVDATDENALLALGKRQFSAALCSMALFDMADIHPLLHALNHLLLPGGRFVFSIIHPCFDNPYTARVSEQTNQDGELHTAYAVKVTGYLTPTIQPASAIIGQPQPQLIFHRPLQDLFGAAFAAGFVLDGLEERAFPPNHPAGRNPMGWGGNFSEIPPVMVARLRASG